MEREQYQQVAIAAGALAVLVALMSGRLPRWLRIVLVLSLGILAAGTGLFGYRYITQPTTLTIATGSPDGDVPRIMSAMAARMASTNAPVRLKVVEKATPTEAAKEFADGNVDLVIARADLVDLSIARAVLAVTHGVVLIVVPPGSPIEGMDDLKGKMVGVISADTNRQVIAAITREYALEFGEGEFQESRAERGTAGISDKTDPGPSCRAAAFRKIHCDASRNISAHRQGLAWSCANRIGGGDRRGFATV